MGIVYLRLRVQHATIIMSNISIRERTERENHGNGNWKSKNVLQGVVF